MTRILTRQEAENFVSTLDAIEVLLDKPDWPECDFDTLLELWIEKRGDAVAPRRADIDLVLVPDLVPLIQIYQVVTTPDHADEAKIIYQGGSIASYTREETGTFAFADDVVSKEIRRAYRAYFDFVTHWDQPVWVEGGLTSWRREMFRREKYISLPLSSDGDTIDGALTASHFFMPKT